MLAALSLAFVTSVKADQMFDFTIANTASSGPSIWATGTLTTSDTIFANVGGTGLDGYKITGITGQRNGDPITGLVNNPSFPAYTTVGDVQFDNGLIVTPLGFDFSGLYYTTLAGAGFNVYSDAGQNWEFTAGTYNGGLPEAGATQVNVTLSHVPDATSTLSLTLLGLGLMVGASRMRKNQTGGAFIPA